MNTDKIDPAISSADDLTKTASKSDVELKEEELKRVSGGYVLTDVQISTHALSSGGGAPEN